MNVLCVIGTRPEAIKMAPVLRALRAQPGRFSAHLCLTAQHRDLVGPLLGFFDIAADDDLDVMRPDQSLPELTQALFAALPPVIERRQPDVVLVQGDTTSALVAAMTAFYAGVPVGHIEAGLRTGRLDRPFPEEMNRVVIDRLAAKHFAPTDSARANLIAEGIDPSGVTVTGNTGLDSLAWTRARSPALPAALKGLDGVRIVLVTIHRRESFGQPLDDVCDALVALAELVADDVRFVVTVHPNPNVSEPLRRRLSGRSNILLIDAVDYPQAVALLERCYCVMTDSGGLQEEAPALGKPVLVLRDATERPEGIDAGVARLVGLDPRRIIGAALDLLEDEDEYARMARQMDLYGDGHAARRILDAL